MELKNSFFILYFFKAIILSTYTLQLMDPTNKYIDYTNSYIFICTIIIVYSTNSRLVTQNFI